MKDKVLANDEQNEQQDQKKQIQNNPTEDKTTQPTKNLRPRKQIN